MQPKKMGKVIKTETLHMIVDGEFLQDFARQRYWFEDAESHGYKILKEGLRGIADEQVLDIIHGRAGLKGSSICSNSECSQCKGLEEITLVQEPDTKFQMEIYERIIWLNKKCYKVGEQHISKKLVLEYAEELIAKQLCYARKSEYYSQEYLDSVRRAFWNTNAMPYPSPKFMPQQGTQQYIFTEQVEDFLEKLEDFIKHDLSHFAVGVFEDEFLVNYKVTETESSFTPKKFARGEGMILVTVPDPNVEGRLTDDKTFTVNMPIEHLLNYLDERKRGTRSMKFTQSLQERLEKEKVLKRYKKLEENQAHAHTLLMNSMSLRHVQTGIYHDGMVEYYVNGIIQYFVYKSDMTDILEDMIKDIPKELKLTADMKLIADGKVIEEYLDCR
jgi:hypothetical protein